MRAQQLSLFAPEVEPLSKTERAVLDCLDRQMMTYGELARRLGYHGRDLYCAVDGLIRRRLVIHNDAGYYGLAVEGCEYPERFFKWNL